MFCEVAVDDVVAAAIDLDAALDLVLAGALCANQVASSCTKLRVCVSWSMPLLLGTLQ